MRHHRHATRQGGLNRVPGLGDPATGHQHRQVNALVRIVAAWFRRVKWIADQVAYLVEWHALQRRA
jgi:hypothetical protein